MQRGKEFAMAENSFFTALLKREVVPAMGCTEPAASALAGAKARELLEGQVRKVRISASRDMVKNAMGVGIPGCSLKGISAAVALGVAGGDTSRKLSILSSVTPEMAACASKLSTELKLARDVPSLYVEVTLESDSGHCVSVAISDEHDSFSRIVVDGKVKVDTTAACHTEKDETPLENIEISDILNYADTVDPSSLGFIQTAVDANMAIAKYSIEHRFGLQVGRVMAGDIPFPPDCLNNAFHLGAAYAAAGSDARMSGCPMPVYINSGSGNQGITVTVPVQILGTYLGVGQERILRAICVSELVGLMLTEKKSRLSALCGAFTASIGTACAYAYLLDGNDRTMDRVINTMVANLTGIICDGAKNTCALKIYSCLEAAAMAVKLALNGRSPDEQCGIVGNDSHSSISNLSMISKEGMEETDQTIYSIMTDKGRMRC